MGRGADHEPRSGSLTRAAHPLEGDGLIRALPAASLGEDEAAAWADLNSDAHHLIQAAVRAKPYGWREDYVYVPGVTEHDPDVELHLGQLVDSLDQAIGEHRLPADGIAWRGVLVDWTLRQAGVTDPSELAGMTLTEPGYLSVSADRSCADMWAADTMIRIRLPAGTPALSLPALGYPEQQELLLRRDCTLTVENVREQPDGRWLIDACVDQPR